MNKRRRLNNEIENFSLDNIIELDQIRDLLNRTSMETHSPPDLLQMFNLLLKIVNQRIQNDILHSIIIENDRYIESYDITNDSSTEDSNDSDDEYIP